MQRRFDGYWALNARQELARNHAERYANVSVPAMFQPTRGREAAGAHLRLVP